MTNVAIRAPWDGEVLAEVSLADRDTANRAVELAVSATVQLTAMPSHARRDALARISRTLGARREEFARTLALEAAKPIAQAHAEVMRAESTFLIASEEATRLAGEGLLLDVTASGEGYKAVAWRVPSGPVIGIAPFNFPLNLVAHKVAPALACGCAIVLKPAPQTPLSALLLAEIVREAFGPWGALTVLPCEVDVAESLVTDARFATLSFTGSAKVGWHLKSIAGKKRVLLELGGNAAAIVHEDADLDFALSRIVSGAFGYAGQVCIKVQRVYVHAAIYDRVRDRLLDLAKPLTPSSPLDEKAMLSSMIDESNAKRVDAWVQEALSNGGNALLRGARDGAKLWPSIVAFDDGGVGNKIVDEEVFGPVLTLHRYRTWDEALTMADATRYGLQAGIFTDSRARIATAFERLHVGGLIVGDVPTFRVDNMPYGGMRDSGLGREGVRYAIEEMTERKLLVERSPKK
jgi:acyl-CoA reductase-like NAD-dependent aldehyde dehydrogenase